MSENLIRSHYLVKTLPVWDCRELFPSPPHLASHALETLSSCCSCCFPTYQSIRTNNEEGEGSDRDVDMTDTVGEKPAVSAARSALFSDEAEGGPVTKPVILQHRVSSVANISLQPRVIECVANTASLTRGLGGMSVLGSSNLSSGRRWERN